MATKLAKKAPKAAKKTTAKPAAKKDAALLGDIAYYILMVPDMAKAIAFYKSIGLKPGFESPEWTEFNAGIKFALHGPCEDSCGEYEATDTSLSFSVKSCKATIDSFKALGVKITSEPRNVCEDGYAFSFQDPFGNTLWGYGKA